jgi:uncharacterized coiled-coil protein SlyX
MNFEERIDRLEMELAHQQRMTDQLNDVVSTQSLDILRLRRAIEQLVKQLEEMGMQTEDDEEPLDLADEKPPHY